MFHRVRAVLFAIVVLSLNCLAADLPEKRDLPVVPMKITSIAAFKNGLAFIMKQGSGPVAKGEGRILNVPRATLGSLWLAPSDPGGALEEMVAYRYPVKKTHAAVSVSDLLENSIGKTVTVRYGDKEYSGELMAISEEPAKLSTDFATQRPEYHVAPVAPATHGPRILLLKSEGKTVAMNADMVTVVAIQNVPSLTITDETLESALRFRLKGAPANAQLTMGHLQEGLGWTPSYMVTLKDDKTAQLTMQAVLVNDVEDMQDVDVFFVVGAPNFAYADRLSPMALEQSLVQFIRNEFADRRNYRMAMSNAIQSQAVMRLDDNEASPLAGLATVSDLSGSPEQDMFLYNLPHITLAKNERGSYNVFSAEVAYEHLYEWEVEERRTVDVYGSAVSQYNQPSSDQTIKDPVWHSLVLKNTSKFPWTSAPAMVLSSNKPVAQDTVRYTPKGASGNLKLTIATDVRTSKKEVEVERKPRAAKFYDDDYDVVTVEGVLKLTSYKQHPIKVSVTKKMVGTVSTADETPKIEKTAEELRGVNPTSRINWDLTLAPGVQKIVKYRYQVYVKD